MAHMGSTMQNQASLKATHKWRGAGIIDQSYQMIHTWLKGTFRVETGFGVETSRVFCSDVPPILAGLSDDQETSKPLFVRAVKACQSADCTWLHMMKKHFCLTHDWRPLDFMNLDTRLHPDFTHRELGCQKRSPGLLFERLV